MPRIPLFPLDIVVYPGEPVPLHVFEERYLLMTEECLATGAPIGVALARQDEPEGTLEHEPERVGTAVYIIAHEKLEDGRYLLATVGARRFRVERVVSDRPFQEADVEWLDEPVGDETAAARSGEAVRGHLARIGAGEVGERAEGPVELSYRVAAALQLPLPLKQQLLTAPTAEERLAVEEALLGGRLAPE